jgi:hypothetical protein
MFLINSVVYQCFMYRYSEKIVKESNEEEVLRNTIDSLSEGEDTRLRSTNKKENRYSFKHVYVGKTIIYAWG